MAADEPILIRGTRHPRGGITFLDPTDVSTVEQATQRITDALETTAFDRYPLGKVPPNERHHFAADLARVAVNALLHPGSTAQTSNPQQPITPTPLNSSHPDRHCEPPLTESPLTLSTVDKGTQRLTE